MIEQYVGMGNRDIPPCLAETYAEGTKIVTTLAKRVLVEIPLSDTELQEDWLSSRLAPRVSLVTTGVNGSRVQWLCGTWGVRIRVKAFGPRELERVREIFGLVKIDEFLLQPATVAWLYLDLCISARIRRE